MPDERQRETDVLVARPRIDPTAGDVLAPGTMVGNWRISALIAAGGCGVVYSARHPVLDRAAAVKVLHAALATADIMVDRFIREARAVNQIRHPNIVDIFDFGTLPDGRPFFVMELLAPGDLEQRVLLGGRLTLPEIAAILTPVCHALEAAHRAGYIHRDLKARNIGFALAPDGSEVPKLLDFGIAKLLEEDHDGVTTTIRVGTPHCMSPEQIRGDRIDARTDVYALGVLLYQLLTGRYPFDASDASEVERLHLEAPPPAPSRLVRVAPGLDALVVRSLAKSADDRPASAREFLDALTAIAAPRRDADAIGIHVVFDVPATDDDLADAAAAAERAATLLGEHGFTPVLVTPTSVLAVDHLREDRDAAHARARAITSALERTIAERPGARDRVAARIQIHTGVAEIAENTGAFVGGPLLDVETWPR